MRWIFTFALAASFFFLAASSDAEDVVAICPADFREAVTPWKLYRESQGYRVHLIESKPSTTELLRDLQSIAASTGSLRAIVLFGDCSLSAGGESADPLLHVPTHYAPSPVVAAFGSTETIATDSAYGDLNRDGAQEIPVGRIPIDRADQVAGFVQRLKDYETSTDFGAWRNTCDLTAGVGGFGRMIDTAIESVARGIITSKMPGFMHTRITYASPRSPFFPGFSQFADTVHQRFSDGGLFWVYAGHGQVTELDRVPATASGRPIMGPADVSKLKRPAGRAPIALMLACFTGAYDARSDCLSERMLMEPGGPIAVLAGSRMTLPYGNAVVATSLIKTWFEEQPPTLGEAWVRTLKCVALDPTKQANAPNMIDAMAAMISPSGNQLPQERVEHTHLYNLFGDPLLKLKHPGNLSLDAPISVDRGATIDVGGTSNHAGKLIVEVHRRGEPSASELKGLAKSEQHRLANESMLMRTEREIAAGEFVVQIALPNEIENAANIIARVEGERDFSLGSDRVLIRRPRTYSDIKQAR